jgi:hypothetical protein
MRCLLEPGGVPERLNGAVSKTVGVARRSWVRIPPPPSLPARTRVRAQRIAAVFVPLLGLLSRDGVSLDDCRGATIATGAATLPATAQ